MEYFILCTDKVFNLNFLTKLLPNIVSCWWQNVKKVLNDLTQIEAKLFYYEKFLLKNFLIQIFGESCLIFFY